jgi:hypothetical protein
MPYITGYPSPTHTQETIHMKYRVQLTRTVVQTVEVEVEVGDLAEALNIENLAVAEANKLPDDYTWTTLRVNYATKVLT